MTSSFELLGFDAFDALAQFVECARLEGALLLLLRCDSLRSRSLLLRSLQLLHDAN